MKKLLFILFLLPLYCFSQSSFTPQFKRNIPDDSLLIYSVPGITGIKALPDTAWVKKHIKFVNPMTAVGDLIVGGTVTGGIAAPTKLAMGHGASGGGGIGNTWLTVNPSGTALEYKTFVGAPGLQGTYTAGSFQLILQDINVTSTNANIVSIIPFTLYSLPIITANRTIDLGTPVNYAGQRVSFLSKNTSGFTWNFVTNIPIDATGANVTGVINNIYYTFYSDGTHWILVGSGGGGGGAGTVTSIATSTGILGGPITTTGTLKLDTTLAQTVLNFFPKGDTRYAKISTTAIQPYDYIVTTDGTNITASPRLGTGLTKYTGTDAYTVIQNAITALSTGNGGSIYLAKGSYSLSNELTITGWNSNSPTSASLTIYGDAQATQINQTTSGKNAFIVKNSASINFHDFYVYTGSAALSGIFLSNGGTSEVSVFGARIDNVFLQSDATGAPAFRAIDFFDLQVDHLYALNSSNDGISLENNSTTTNYGNSQFGLVRASGGSTFAGLRMTSSAVAFKYINLITFGNYQCIGGLYGIYMKGVLSTTFSHIDVEGVKFPVYLDGTANNEVLGNRINGGYILPSGTGNVGITCTQYAGGNTFNVFVDGGSAVIPVSDVLVSGARPSNQYDLTLGTNINAANISIASTQAVVKYRKASDGLTNFTTPINAISNLTSNGLVQTTGGNGALSVVTTTLPSSIVTSSLTTAALAALTATNTTLTFSGSYNGNTARTVGLNLSNANTWAALQTFGANISIGGVTATGATGTGAVAFSASPGFTGTVGLPAVSLTGNIVPLTGNTYSIGTSGSVLSGVWTNTNNVTTENANTIVVGVGTPSGTVTQVTLLGSTSTGALNIVGNPSTASYNFYLPVGAGSSGSLLTSTGGSTPMTWTSLATGMATFFGAPSSANLIAAMTDETGTGSLVFAGSPALTGTPTAPTQTTTDASTAIATDAFVQNNFTANTIYFASGTFTGAGTSSSPFALGQVVGISQLTATGTASSSTYLRGDNTWATVSGGGTGANPTQSVGLSIVNGIATTFMRSDGAPAIDQSIAPTWTGLHTFNKQSIGVTSTDGILLSNTTASTNVLEQWAPALHFAGTYWTGSASAVTDWKIENQSSGTQGLLVFRYQNAGGGYNTAGYFAPGSFNTGGLLNLNQGFFGATSTDVLIIQNTAASSAGTPLQKSGRERFLNSIWNTTATAAANYGHATVELTGVSGTTPTAAMLWSGGLTTTTTPSLSGLMSLDLSGGTLTLLKSGLIANKPGLAQTVVSGIDVLNATLATSGVTNQYAPGVHWGGNVWNTTATAANNTTDWVAYVSTISGTTPSSAWTLLSSLTTGAPSYTPVLTIQNNGNAQLTGSLTIGGSAGPRLFITEGTGAPVGQTTLVAGTKAITVTGATTSSRGFVTLVSSSSGSLTTSYQAVCTSGTLTLRADVAAGTINTADVSTVNYFVVN